MIALAAFLALACAPSLTVVLPSGQTINASGAELRGDVLVIREAALFRDGFE